MTVCTDVYVRPQTCTEIFIYPSQVHPVTPTGGGIGGNHPRPYISEPRRGEKKKRWEDDEALALLLIEWARNE